MQELLDRKKQEAETNWLQKQINKADIEIRDKKFKEVAVKLLEDQDDFNACVYYANLYYAALSGDWLTNTKVGPSESTLCKGYRVSISISEK